MGREASITRGLCNPFDDYPKRNKFIDGYGRANVEAEVEIFVSEGGG